MMDSILEQSAARRRHRVVPLLKEREQFLSHLLQRGTSQNRVRSVAAYLIHIIRLMELTTLRRVDLEEIKKAGVCFGNYRGPHRRGSAGRTAAYSFTNVAKNWFRFHGQLAIPPAPPLPFDEQIRDFVEFMRSAQGLSPVTIRGYSSRAGIFLGWLAKRQNSLSSVSLNDVDEFLASKATDGWCPGTLATHCQALRAFFGYAGIRGWCAPSIARGIPRPAVSKYTGLGGGPTWKDVRQLLQSTRGNTPATLRARAILSLCSIYALRSSEIGRLRLGDFDWRDETFSVQRSKRGGIQHYPIQYEVGEAILRYLRSGRPHCSCRHVFVTLRPPYRPLQSSSLWQVVSARIKQLGIASRHKGPHALRHACATRLLKKGTSLKEIADFLGHRDPRSIGIYAKYDTRSLRKVAAFRLAGLQ